MSFKGNEYPLILSSKAPNDGVWFRDKIKIAAFCMLLENTENRGYVYHCFDGELRKVEVTGRDRYNVLKLVERVIRLHKGFVPERKESSKCGRCKYEDVCENEPSTFASRFL